MSRREKSIPKAYRPRASCQLTFDAKRLTRAISCGMVRGPRWQEDSMKKWLVEGLGVEPVEADIIIGDEVAVRLANGHAFMASVRDLFESEDEARRVDVERRVDALEELADKHDRQRADAEKLAKGHMDDAEWNRAEAAALRARAKGLRDALKEVAS